jgi:hypothetical protein
MAQAHGPQASATAAAPGGPIAATAVQALGWTALAILDAVCVDPFILPLLLSRQGDARARAACIWSRVETYLVLPRRAHAAA